MEMTHSSAKLALFHLYTLLDHGYLSYGVLFGAIVLVIAALAFRAIRLNIEAKLVQIPLYLLISLLTLFLWHHIYDYYRLAAVRKFCQLYMDRGAVNAAEKWLVELEASGKHPIYSQYMRGMAAHRRRKFTEAAQHFSFVVSHDKYNFRAWQNLVQCLISARQIKKAKERLEEAKSILEPHFPGTLLLLRLRLLIAQSKKEEAKKVAQKAVKAGLLAQWQIGGLFQ